VRVIRETQTEHGTVLSDIRDSLGEILRRMPPPPGGAQETAQ
jgi:hypothetical protein